MNILTVYCTAAISDSTAVGLEAALELNCAAQAGINATAAAEVGNTRPNLKATSPGLYSCEQMEFCAATVKVCCLLVWEPSVAVLDLSVHRDFKALQFQNNFYVV